MYICSVHFLPEDFIKTHGLTRLKKSAIQLTISLFEENIASTSKEFLSPRKHQNLEESSPVISNSSGSISSTGEKRIRITIDHLY